MNSSDSSIYSPERIERLLRGDREVFDQFARLYRNRLLSIIRLRIGRTCQPRLDPEDVLQETLLRAYRGLESFRWDGPARLIAWLTTIAERTSTDCVRRHVTAKKNELKKQISLADPVDRRTSAASLADLLCDHSQQPLRDLRRQERLKRLERALEGLDERYREVIVLSILQRLPTQEVAGRMELSSGAVCMLRTRALDKLRDLFGNTESLGLPDRALPASDGSESVAQK